MIEALEANPIVLVPGLMVAIKFALSLGPYLRTRDWYSLYLSGSQAGVDLVFLALGLTASAALRAGLSGHGDIGIVLVSIGVLVLALCVVLAVGAEVKRRGRESVAAVHKVPLLTTVFVDELVKKMIAAITRMAFYSKNRPRLWVGVAGVFFAISVGAASVAWAARLVIQNRLE